MLNIQSVKGPHTPQVSHMSNIAAYGYSARKHPVQYEASLQVLQKLTIGNVSILRVCRGAILEAKNATDANAAKQC